MQIDSISVQQGDYVVRWKRLLRNSRAEDAQQDPRQQRSNGAQGHTLKPHENNAGEDEAAGCGEAPIEKDRGASLVRDWRTQACRNAVRQTPQRSRPPEASWSASQPHKRFDMEGLGEKIEEVHL